MTKQEIQNDIDSIELMIIEESELLTETKLLKEKFVNAGRNVSSLIPIDMIINFSEKKILQMKSLIEYMKLDF